MRSAVDIRVGHYLSLIVCNTYIIRCNLPLIVIEPFPLSKKMRNQNKAGIEERLSKLIVTGKLKPSTRLVESALAEKMGVSRTLMREALMGLERRGFLKHVAEQGFHINPMTSREVREIYPLIWTLECLGLKMCSAFGAERIQALTDLNNQFREASEESNPHQARDIDTKWHEVLLAGCRNKTLINMLSDLKLRAYRYECAYMSKQGAFEVSVQQHAQIISLVSNGRIDEAAQVIELHWDQGMRVVLEELDWTEPD